MSIQPRPCIAFVKEFFKEKRIICMEIGVQEGSHARDMIQYLEPEKIVLVDRWETYHRQGTTESYVESAMKVAMERARGGNTESIFLKGDSKDILPRLEEDSFDFIYIDADHSPMGCAMDIINSVPLVKIGGIVGGHDYLSNGKSGIVFHEKEHGDVPRAVHFIFDNMFIHTGPGCWWVIVDEKIKIRCKEKREKLELM